MTDFPVGQIPVYYINVASRLDRRQFMEQQFARLGIVAGRIDAVTPAEVSDARMAPHSDPANPRALARVEVACTMSHERIWRRQIELGQPFVLILEDDVIMGDGLKSLLAPSIYAGVSAELVKLETFCEPVRVGRALSTIGRFTIRQLLASHLGTGAYVISMDMAERVLADPALQRLSIDQYLFSRNGPIIPSRRLLQVDPAPTIQLMNYRGGKAEGVSHSDIQPARVRNHATAQSRNAAHRVADFTSRASYTLRLLAHTLSDKEARRQKRREIPYEPGA